MLDRLIERVQALHTDDTEDSGDGTAQSALAAQWDEARANANSPAERAEIDAIFGRHAA